jgi:predicted Rdx family selenoprotein
MLRNAHIPKGRERDMVRYQFQVDDELWEEWKETVPRSKSLEQRLIELIEADKEGRVSDRSEGD